MESHRVVNNVAIFVIFKIRVNILPDCIVVR